MQRLKTQWLAGAVSVALCAPCPSQQTVDLTPETLTTNHGTKLDAELGRIEVPENRGEADSNRIQLAFLRVKSPRENPGAPIFVLAGGPGGSSIRNIRGMIASASPEMLAILPGDIVGIDQRGVGRSRPNLTRIARYGFSVAGVADPAKMLELAKQTCRQEVEHWREEGVDLRGYTTVESADDLDAVRRALGYDKIVLWGGSYGSHLALATLRRHEAHIERICAFGPEGPDHTIKLPSYAEDGLARISKLVAEDPQFDGKIPDLMRLVREVLERLEREPVFVDAFDPTAGKRVQVGISKFDVQSLLAQAIGRVRTMRTVPAWIYAMAHGDFEATATQVVRFRVASGVRSAMAAMMDCASGISPERAARVAAEAKECVLGAAVNFPYPEISEAWGSPDLGSEFRGPLHSDVPILFVVGDLDSRTPVANARELMRHLPNSHLIVVENAGHDLAATQLPDVRAAIARFLQGQEVELTRATDARPTFDPLPKIDK